MAAPSGFTATQIRLHWIVFILIVAQYVLHEGISQAWDAVERGQPAGFNPIVASHVLFGILVLALTLWRLTIRTRRGAPPPPEDEPAVLKLAASATHFALYALLILMPLSGLAAWFGGAEMAAEAHETMRIVLLALVALHVGGALYHHFILKTDVLTRMRRPG
ncbi:cytochrome b [Oricola sp.]|uniref:cytochrome b n=1 Tax=Oricola sp. TaxID=1979950 RepID=UPI003BAB9098